MTSHRARRLLFVGLVALTITPFAAFNRAEAAPQWAPISTATIRPSNGTVTGSSACSSNFVFTNGNDVLLGQAAHCAQAEGSDKPEGCVNRSQPIGTPVQVDGAENPGTLVYSSWLAMQNAQEPNPNACAYNDLSLIRLNGSDVNRVNPTMPHWGGPTGLDTNGTVNGEQVFAYGNSPLRQGIFLLRPMRGSSRGSIGAGWGQTVFTLTPGIPGDSGSGYLNKQGQAIGVLSTYTIGIPGVFTNNLSDLNYAIIYARAHGMPQLQLVKGTVGFDPKGRVG